MKITVAIAAYHSHNHLCNCLKAILNQRVIQADKIKIYNISIPDNILEQLEKKKCQIINTFYNSKFNEAKLLSSIINDNKDADILMLVDPACEIARSSISEFLRLFLKYNDLALVYGRQMPPSADSSLLTRFWYSYFFPLTKRDEPMWHFNRVFCSYKMMALKMSLISPEYTDVKHDYNHLGDIYLGANILKNGLRLIYNPMALTIIHKQIKLKDIFETARDLQYFILDNQWMHTIWSLRSNEITMFTKNLFSYLHTYSSHPLTWFSGPLAYAFLIIGLYVGRHNYEIEHERELYKSSLKDKKQIK